jgi:hypothetical protein
MNYKTQNEAIAKIARELGSIKGAVSLPKIFPHLETESYGYKIPKSSHIVDLLSSSKSKNEKFVVLQKIFAQHRSLSQIIVKEIKPALNKLGFDYKDGVIVELIAKRAKTFKMKVSSTTRKFSQNSSLISESIFRKGERLSDAYLAIYLIENHLRLFIWKVVGKSNRKLSRYLGIEERRKISNRKTQEKQNKWLPLRKDSNLFYLDVEDLGCIMQSNWTIFKKYFPDPNWIIVKIQEVALIRNRIAHNNSSISDTEKKALELYMEQIYSQIQ